MSKHPNQHPLWKNRNAYSAFQDVLRCFWDKHGRTFEEWRLWSYYYDLLKECL